MSRRDDLMSPAERIIVCAIGALIGAWVMFVCAYAGPILRWQIAVLNKLAALVS